MTAKFAAWGCGFFSIMWKGSHTNSRGTACANEHCQGARMQGMRVVCHSRCMEFSASLLSQTKIHTKFIVPAAHFHTNVIGASPVVIAHKTIKKWIVCGLNLDIAPVRT